MDDLWTLESLAALFTLTGLEIVLGIDNIVVLAVVSGRLPVSQRSKAQRVGLSLAMIMRIVLLLSISLIVRMQQPLFTLWGRGFNLRDMVLLFGGLFLVWKSVREIHEKTEQKPESTLAVREVSGFRGAIVQIILLDMVFSIDSVITAVGMSQQIPIMVAAVVLAVLVMMFFASPVTGFVNRHPSIHMLALAFLLLIGVMLVSEGLGKHIEKGYIYFAMAFSLLVEMLNIRERRVRRSGAAS